MEIKCTQLFQFVIEDDKSNWAFLEVKKARWREDLIEMGETVEKDLAERERLKR